MTRQHDQIWQKDGGLEQSSRNRDQLEGAFNPDVGFSLMQTNPYTNKYFSHYHTIGGESGHLRD